jgi:hypothetical protein
MNISCSNHVASFVIVNIYKHITILFLFFWVCVQSFTQMLQTNHLGLRLIVNTQTNHKSSHLGLRLIVNT